MEKKGGRVKNMVAACAGGASMFTNSYLKKKDDISIGERNFQMVKKHLDRFEIPLINKAVGGTSGSRVIFNCSDGTFTVMMLDRTFQ